MDSHDKYHYPVYMDTTKTEALHFQLDPRRVLAWLKVNDTIDKDIHQLSDEKVKAWFINYMQEVDFFGEIANKDTEKGIITYYLFTLLLNSVVQFLIGTWIAISCSAESIMKVRNR
jgi:hypothetical protein